MNPSQTPNPNTVSAENLLEKAFENSAFPQAPQIDEENLVTHSDTHKAQIKNSWAEFYALKTEEIVKPTPESTVNKAEITETKIETRVVEMPKYYEREEKIADNKPVFAIENQKGSGSWMEDAGLKLDFPALGKSIFKNVFGGLNIFREIFSDTFSVIKKAFTEKILTPEQAKKAAEKKAKQKEKNARIQAFYDQMAAQKASVVAVEVDRAQTREKENINKTVKLNTSYKGIKDSFGRLTVYAASMFEREQIEEEKRCKKIEKQQKIASSGAKGPDLNMDKVAEGGFLSSTGGQGAG